MTITVSSGHTSTGLTISHGDPLVVLSGGTVEAIKILSGGSATISSGATGSGFAISSGGTLMDFGYAQSAVVSAGALMEIGDGVYAASGYYNSVLSGGTYIVGSQAISLLSVIESGGTELVSSTAYVDIVSAGATQTVEFPGYSYESVIYGWQYIYGEDDGDIVSGGSANQFIENGGSGQSASLSAGAHQQVLSGGQAYATSVGDTARQIVDPGGYASGTVVLSGGTDYLDAGSDGDSLIVSAGGVLEGPGGLFDNPDEPGAGSYTTVAGAVSGVTVGYATEDMLDTEELQLLSGGVAQNVTATGGDAYQIGFGSYIQVDSGARATGTVLEGGGYDIVYGLSTSTTVSGGGAEYVFSGGEATATTVLDGGTDNLAADASGIGVTVSAGGGLYGPGVLLGADAIRGVASGVSIGAGATETVYVGGLASGTNVLSGGQEVISGGGHAIDATVSSGGVEDVLASGKFIGATTGTVVSGGGEQRVVSGGVASATVVSSGGRQYVSSGGAAVDTMASSGGAIDVLAAGTLAGTVVSGGGEAVVSSGGDATGTTVLGGGIVFVRSSGATTGTVVSSGGLALVSSGGLASGTTVLSGGQEVVYSGGVASGTVVSGHGRETISSGAEARGLTVSAGGVVVDDGEVRISGAGTLDGTLSGSGLIVQAAAGDLLLSGSDAAFGGGAVISGGVIELATAGALGSGYAQFVTPTTGSAVLQIDAADAPAAGGTFANTIYDFSSAGEDIDLASIAFVSGASATVSGTTLVLTDGGKTYRFKLGGVIAGAYPVLSDGHGGTLIDPKVLAFAHSLAVFAPPHAANTALASSTSPAGQTPLLHAIAPLSAGRI